MGGRMRPTRRSFLMLGAAMPAVLFSFLARATEPSKDQGIGGTGWTAGTDNDNGIGGTGIVGTIQRFGSIFVNDVRVAYDADVPVWVDDAPVTISSLKVGHVVRVAVTEEAGRVVTRVIHVTSEVVGPVEWMSAGSIRVLGQSVDIGAAPNDPTIRKGDIVAVYGIRRPDGTIVASLVEARPGETHFLVRGVAAARSGSLLVGRLKVGPKSSGLANRRVHARLAKAGGGYSVVSLEAEAPVPQADVASVLYETFLQRMGRRLVSGLGVAIVDRDGSLKSSDAMRVFLTVGIDHAGNIVSASRDRNPGMNAPSQPGMPSQPPAGPGMPGPGAPGAPNGQPNGGSGGPGGPGGSGPGGPSGP
ncbi:hypothetical protein FJ987_28770 [Mesorhizobium sp. CU2]|uniref:DUF5666 domain-containing protein n=1 Tax=unclassified Mesorhizobium TaxID=325217 RepID=UPI001128FA48|nr:MULTISPECIES: DUF5666 domain-containing protein [unclassified Mesorhizobium]TPN80692.1 hypothetical protein FJ988_21675 [Mesorhizobium sp. CU3]TPO02572.1 hypothetical protein FJ987_28770 [Mesorhizobium sp. CU2]